VKTYGPTRDAIYNELLSVEGIGRVFKSPRYVSEWKTFLDRFKTQSFENPEREVVCVGWLTRSSAFEVAAKDESDVTVHITKTETWNGSLYYGFRDDDEQPSEFDFQELADRVQDRFEFLDRLSGLTWMHSVDPIDLQSAGVAMINNEVLAHRADFVLRITHHIDTP